MPDHDRRCGKCKLPAPRHSAACPSRSRPRHTGPAIQGSGYTPAQLIGGEPHDRDILPDPPAAETQP
ncbi:hypothetical protein ACIO1C_29515 [Streptomyces sp. NPDC087420]|uniref:hypothetical protein n=1 Tax=Streptomyces sp. NPDC087420 TaxID=3365785 RepID=UPI00383956B4